MSQILLLSMTCHQFCVQNRSNKTIKCCILEFMIPSKSIQRVKPNFFPVLTHFKESKKIKFQLFHLKNCFNLV